MGAVGLTGTAAGIDVVGVDVEAAVAVVVVAAAVAVSFVIVVAVAVDRPDRLCSGWKAAIEHRCPLHSRSRCSLDGSQSCCLRSSPSRLVCERWRWRSHRLPLQSPRHC